MPRRFGGKEYVFWFSADSKAEAERAIKDMKRTGKWDCRMTKVKRGYNVYTRHR